jgi:hypothetical protein
MNPEPIPYIDRLRTELVEGVARDRPRRRRRRHVLAASAVAALAALLVLGIGTLDGGDRSTALAVTRDDHWITVEIADATADPDRMTKELRAAGIDGEVVIKPVSPSLEGRWVALEVFASTPVQAGENPNEKIVSITELADEAPRGGPGAGRPNEDRLFAIDFDHDEMRIPNDFRDRVVLTAGRAPRGDELYTQSASAFAPGEPLHCTGIERLSPTAAEEAIAAKGFRVHRVVVPDPESLPGSPRPPVSGPDVVIGAQLLSTHRLAREAPSPHGREEMILFVSSAPKAPIVYPTPPQDCGP